MINKIISNLENRIDKETIEKLLKLNETSSKEIIEEMNILIEKFNNSSTFEFCINASHLKEVLTSVLPPYEGVLATLEANEEIHTKVLEELQTSDYLNEVWNLRPIKTLYINIIILIYRTTLLIKYPYLREQKAQISSTLEEMAALLELDGKHIKIFQGIKHWIINWKEEEMSEELYKALKEKNLF